MEGIKAAAKVGSSGAKPNSAAAARLVPPERADPNWTMAQGCEKQEDMMKQKAQERTKREQERAQAAQHQKKDGAEKAVGEEEQVDEEDDDASGEE